MPQELLHPFMTDMVEGNHDTLPILSTSRNASSSRVLITHWSAAGQLARPPMGARVWLVGAGRVRRFRCGGHRCGRGWVGCVKVARNVPGGAGRRRSERRIELVRRGAIGPPPNGRSCLVGRGRSCSEVPLRGTPLRRVQGRLREGSPQCPRWGWAAVAGEADRLIRHGAIGPPPEIIKRAELKLCARLSGPYMLGLRRVSFLVLPAPGLAGLLPMGRRIRRGGRRRRGGGVSIGTAARSIGVPCGS